LGLTGSVFRTRFCLTIAGTTGNCFFRLDMSTSAKLLDEALESLVVELCGRCWNPFAIKSGWFRRPSAMRAGQDRKYVSTAIVMTIKDPRHANIILEFILDNVGAGAKLLELFSPALLVDIPLMWLELPMMTGLAVNGRFSLSYSRPPASMLVV